VSPGAFVTAKKIIQPKESRKRMMFSLAADEI
jgi:hypothetical protein